MTPEEETKIELLKEIATALSEINASLKRIADCTDRGVLLVSKP